MSVIGILNALSTGPKATSELLLVTGSCSGDVARTCAGLIKDGRVRRVDGGSGRGSRAVYALVGDYTPTHELPARTRYSAGQVGPAHPGQTVDRDPCFMCGIRADIGCEHRRAA